MRRQSSFQFYKFRTLFSSSVCWGMDCSYIQVDLAPWFVIRRTLSYLWVAKRSNHLYWAVGIDNTLLLLSLSWLSLFSLSSSSSFSYVAMNIMLREGIVNQWFVFSYFIFAGCTHILPFVGDPGRCSAHWNRLHYLWLHNILALNRQNSHNGACALEQ